jgi:UDP-N-acetylglucosamine 4,6-dehydratase
MTTLIDKTIMITGGTGSFGKAVLHRLLAEDEVARIVIYSRDEKKQHDMRRVLPDGGGANQYRRYQ